MEDDAVFLRAVSAMSGVRVLVAGDDGELRELRHGYYVPWMSDELLSAIMACVLYSAGYGHGYRAGEANGLNIALRAIDAAEAAWTALQGSKAGEVRH